MTSDHQFPDGTAAGWLDVYALFAEQARLQPDALALEIAGPPNVGDAGVLSQHSYADVLGRVDALAGLLQVRGIASISAPFWPQRALGPLSPARTGGLPRGKCNIASTSWNPR